MINDITACNLITSKIEIFNDLHLLANNNIPLFRIVGSLDAFYTDKNILTDHTYIINEVGHYPFFEDINQLKKVTLKIEEILCQMKAQTINCF
jgi:hypothetical protein